MGEDTASAGSGLRARSRSLFEDLANSDPGSADHDRVRDLLIELHLPLARYCARRFSSRGEPYEDLAQVAVIGLIKAVDRFDAGRGIDFSSYATPTILGEIKRHFRDKGWAIRVPRRLQELRISIGSATEDLSQQLGRSPTSGEVAEELGVEIEEVLEGIESSYAYSTLSLDIDGENEDGTGSILETLGAADPGMADIEIRESVRPLIQALPDRDRAVVVLRFYRGMTQSEIAAHIGVSQMHVSRILTRTLAELRTALTGEPSVSPR